MPSHIRTIWSEPRVVDPPRRVRRDWFVWGAMVITVLLEGILRSDMLLRPIAVAVGLALSFTLLWRRTHPLAMVIVMFLAVMGLDVVAQISEGAPADLYSAAFVLINVYALFRWGSGRDAAIGLAVMTVALVVSVAQSYAGVSDIIGGAIVLLLPAELGGLTRFQLAARQQQIEQAKMQEREQLARELHDTVAHHVSAIAIQAQAGQVLARSSSLDGAAGALATIEAEASRTLLEMRAMLGLLRDGDRPAEMLPQRGLDDIDELARSVASAEVRVAVDIDAQLGDVSAPVQAAAYRIAQEAITNVQRHAPGAGAISVVVRGNAESISVEVGNDGPKSPRRSVDQGYGIVGMSERAAMLGGSLVAGPRAEGGWVVRAELPRGR